MYFLMLLITEFPQPLEDKWEPLIVGVQLQHVPINGQLKYKTISYSFSMHIILISLGYGAVCGYKDELTATYTLEKKNLMLHKKEFNYVFN